MLIIMFSACSGDLQQSSDTEITTAAAKEQMTEDDFDDTPRTNLKGSFEMQDES